MTRKYPLDPLRRVRAENVDRKVCALSDSLRHVEAARDEAERIERRKRELEVALQTTVSVEDQLLTQGELTAVDLARGAAFVLATEIERASRARAAEQARAREGAAQVEATQRRVDLADARAASELVAKHHEGWQRAETAASIARDEEDAEQAHLGLRARRGGP